VIRDLPGTRTLRDCAPASLSGVVIRPLNFTVRCQ